MISHRGYAKNEHGVSISLHVCDACHQPFTVCPQIIEGEAGWENCMSRGCDSYDVDRDVDLMFEIEPWRVRKENRP